MAEDNNRGLLMLYGLPRKQKNPLHGQSRQIQAHKDSGFNAVFPGKILLACLQDLPCNGGADLYLQDMLSRNIMM